MAERPGAALAHAIEGELAARRVPHPLLRRAYCLSQCKRPCVVAFAGGSTRFTFLFGDLDPASDASAILDAFELYRARPDGLLARAERPSRLRENILGRVAPPGWQGELIQATLANRPLLARTEGRNP